MKKIPLAVRAAACAVVATGVLAASASADAVPNLETTSATQLEALLQSGSITSLQLTQAYIDRINALNKQGPGLNAVTQFNAQALKDAAQSDRLRAAGTDLGPVMGLPVLLKDIVDAAGLYTSAGNFSLRDSFPAEDSGVTKKLRAGGAIILGKLGLSEWANSFGNQPSGFSNLTGQVINGLDADQNPSGSSSGSGSAGTAALSALTIGTETSGSIISPSSTQGIVGLRPTVGLVPGYGIAPISASQDTAGPMVRTVADAAAELQTIAGADPEADQEYKDIFGDGYLASGVIPTPPDPLPNYRSALSTSFVSGKRIGYYANTIDPTVTTAPAGAPSNYPVYNAQIAQAYQVLVDAGAVMVPLTLQVLPGAGTGSAAVPALSALPSGYEQHKTIDTYLAHLGADAPIKNLVAEVADNGQHPLEALKFGNASHLSESMADISPGGGNEQTYRTNIVQRKAAYHKSLDDLYANQNRSGAPATNDPDDDVIAFLGGLSNTPQAGYPQLTIPMGYSATRRQALAVSVHGPAYGERDVIGVSYVIEQATQLRRPASEVNPSMYRCAATTPAPPHADRGSCNPTYRDVMAQVGTPPDLGFSLEDVSAARLQGRMTSGSLTSEDLTKAYLQRIALSNADGPVTQAVRYVNPNAVTQAKALDAERARTGARSALFGLPVLVDDSVDVAGWPTTGGSSALQATTPTRDATMVSKLKAAGAIIIGKANISELNGELDANAAEGYSYLGGQVLAPFDTDKSPTGSSAGTTAGVSSGLAALGVGLETSTDSAQLIGPSSVNGVVGLKATVGRISRTGTLPVAKSQDAPGVIAKTVTDAANELQVLGVRDSSDAATAAAPTGQSYTAGLSTGALSGKSIAVVSSTAVPYPAAISALQDAGASTTVVTPGSATTQPSIVAREFKRDLNAYLGAVPGGAGSLQSIIDHNTAHADEELKYGQGELTAAQATDIPSDATYVTNRDTGKSDSQAVINNVLRGPDATAGTADDYDALVVPNGSGLVNIADRAGYPMLSVPAGYGATASGSGHDPIGVTLIGTAYSEATLLADGYAFEQQVQARVAPSLYNPSMWRCVPGSSFYSPYKCNPGASVNTNEAFAAIASGATGTPPSGGGAAGTGADGGTLPPGSGSGEPAGTAPGTPSTNPASSGAPAATKAQVDAAQLKALKAATTAKGTKVTLKLTSHNRALSFTERFVETGTARYTLTLSYKSGKKTKVVTVGTKTLTVVKPGSRLLKILLSAKQRRLLSRYAKGTVALKVAFKSKASGKTLSTTRTVKRA